MKNVVVGILYQVVDGTKLYLLMSSTKDFGKFTGLLYPPGGHLEEGEDERHALEREVAEELGIKVEPVKKLLESPGDVPDQVTHWWLCKPLSTDINIKVDEGEVRDIKWLTEEEILKSPALIWPATYKFFTEHFFKRP
jgi:8-oxo-dGTP pyrophosphatase MutT (NUDIX family)